MTKHRDYEVMIVLYDGLMSDRSVLLLTVYGWNCNIGYNVWNKPNELN